MSTVCLDIVTTGWEFPGWERGFYPEDLPADWRLSYFANEFHAVLVPKERWVDASESLLRAWYEDVHEDFRFYLAHPGRMTTSVRLEPVRRALGGKLAGLLIDEEARGLEGRQIPVYQLLHEPTAGLPLGSFPAWRIPPALIGDLRAARAWLETLASGLPGGRGLLVLGGKDTDVEDLRQWWNLAWLMGVAA